MGNNDGRRQAEASRARVRPADRADLAKVAFSVSFLRMLRYRLRNFDPLGLAVSRHPPTHRCALLFSDQGLPRFEMSPEAARYDAGSASGFRILHVRMRPPSMRVEHVDIRSPRDFACPIPERLMNVPPRSARRRRDATTATRARLFRLESVGGSIIPMAGPEAAPTQ